MRIAAALACGLAVIAAGQVAAQPRPAGINPQVICSPDYDISAYADAPIPDLDLRWERQVEVMHERFAKEIKHTDGGIRVPEDFISIHIWERMDGQAFAVDQAKGRYVLKLLGLNKVDCVLEFSSAATPVWADRICVLRLPLRNPPELDLDACPRGTAIARYVHFVQRRLSGDLYAPDFVSMNSFDLDEYRLLFLNQFSATCRRLPGMTHGGTIGLPVNEKQFVSLLIEGFDGRAGAIFANECMVGIATERWPR